MALKVAGGDNKIFFAKIFGGVGHPVPQAVEQLMAAGVVFEVSLYTIKAQYMHLTWQQPLTVGTTTLMKGDADPLIADQARYAIRGFVGNIFKKVTGQAAAWDTPASPPVAAPLTYSIVIKKIAVPSNQIPVIKVIREMTKIDLYSAKQMATKALSGITSVVKSGMSKEDVQNWALNLKAAGADVAVMDSQGVVVYNLGADVPHPNAPNVSATPGVSPIVPPISKAKPVDSVVALRDAKALGQKVKGTSPGSVYYCVAYNDRVKVAARVVSNSSISLRAEWVNPTPDEMSKLKDSGLTLKDKNYASLHVQPGEVPVGRVVGAFLMGIGIKFDEQVTYAGQLVTE